MNILISILFLIAAISDAIRYIMTDNSIYLILAILFIILIKLTILEHRNEK